jgi:cardiolipin synthase A/B
VIRRAGRYPLITVLFCVLFLVLLFAFIGLLHITRSTTVRNVGGITTEGTAVSVSEPLFPAGVTMLTGAPLTAGHQVEIMLNGDGTYPRVWKDLQSAQHSITLELYYGDSGRMVNTLGEILRNRVSAGVRVWMLYDAFGAANVPNDEINELRKIGVQIEAFRPIRISSLHLAQNRSHVRGIVIDGRIGWTGGFGIDDKWLGDGRTNGSWRETNVRFEGPAVRQLQGAFAAGWAEATGVLFSGRAIIETQTSGSAVAGFLHTSPTQGSTSAERFLALSIAGAQTTLYITNAYFAPDSSFVDLLTAAAKRGVDVRILTAGPGTDVNLVRNAGRSWYERLLGSGVRVYEWQPSTLHAKTFVVDSRWSSVGSMNFDNRSLTLNDEGMLMVLDENIGQQMDRIFLSDLQSSKEITISDFGRRSWFERVRERVARLMTRLL